MKKPKSIAEKLERIACDYRNEMEFAIGNLNSTLELRHRRHFVDRVMTAHTADLIQLPK